MAVIALAIVIISAGVKVVPQSETRVVERLGRFHSVLSPGLNFIIPFIDRPKTIYTRRIETAPQRTSHRAHDLYQRHRPPRTGL